LSHTAEPAPAGPQRPGSPEVPNRRAVAECGDSGDIADSDLDDVVRRRVPVRIRVAQALVVVIVAAVMMGLVVHSGVLAPGRSPVAVATPTLVPSGPFLLLSNVFDATVPLNGVPLAGAPPLVASF